MWRMRSAYLKLMVVVWDREHTLFLDQPLWGLVSSFEVLCLWQLSHFFLEIWVHSLSSVSLSGKDRPRKGFVVEGHVKCDLVKQPQWLLSYLVYMSAPEKWGRAAHTEHYITCHSEENGSFNSRSRKYTRPNLREECATPWQPSRSKAQSLHLRWWHSSISSFDCQGL